MRFYSLVIWIVACFGLGCGYHGNNAAPQQTVVVFAAASTKETVEQMVRDFQTETGIPVEVSLGPSSGLAKQIAQGASADVFLSADQASADYLASKDLVRERRNFLTNRLVVVVPTASEVEVKELKDLAGPRVNRLALAEPKVPAGEYTRQALRKAGIWEKVETRLVGAIDVRATLQFVARGEAEAGMVYRTDASGSPKVRIALEIDPSLHEPIQYPVVLLRREAAKDAAQRFYDYLRTEKAAAVFERAGFGVTR